MKAERRHELQTNTLALWLRWKAPEVWQKYGTHILLGIIVILLAIVLIRHLMNKPIEQANRAADAIAAARQDIQRMLGTGQMPTDPQSLVTNIETVLEGTNKPEIQAEGHLTLGDYYWALFSIPKPPGADTQPTFTTVESPQELLGKAEQNYTAAMNDKANSPYVTTRARFGLAAVAEARAYENDRQVDFKTRDEKNWSAAKEQYQAIVDDQDTPQSLKDEAKWHLEQLKEVTRPIWLAPPPPSTGPATTQTTQPAQPFTLPVLQTFPYPATRPTTSPVTAPAR
jgi:type II secretory pathway pseudopilin PulG